MPRDPQEEAHRFTGPLIGGRVPDLRGVETVYADENVWLSQKMMSQLYDVEVASINYHLKKDFEDSELEQEAVRKFPITAGGRKTYDTDNLSATIAVGYKVNSERRVQSHGAQRGGGYVVHVAELAALGFVVPRFPVNVFGLGHDGFDGLLGMSSPSDFNCEIRSAECILVERITSYPWLMRSRLQAD